MEIKEDETHNMFKHEKLFTYLLRHKGCVAS